MILGPIGNVTEPQKPLFLNLYTPNYFKIFKKIQKHVEAYHFWTFTNLETRNFQKRCVPTNPEGPSYIFLKILNMGSISIGEHGMKICHFR